MIASTPTSMRKERTGGVGGREGGVGEINPKKDKERRGAFIPSNGKVKKMQPTPIMPQLQRGSI